MSLSEHESLEASEPTNQRKGKFYHRMLAFLKPRKKQVQDFPDIDAVKQEHNARSMVEDWTPTTCVDSPSISRVAVSTTTPSLSGSSISSKSPSFSSRRFSNLRIKIVKPCEINTADVPKPPPAPRLSTRRALRRQCSAPSQDDSFCSRHIQTRSEVFCES